MKARSPVPPRSFAGRLASMRKACNWVRQRASSQPVCAESLLAAFCLPTNEALPALESDPIRFGESFDVLPFTVHKRREVDAWKSELAHKFGEVKNRRLAGGALFSRFDVVGHGGLFSRLAVVGHGALFSRFALIGDGALFRRFAVLGHDAFLGWSNVLAS